MANKNIVKGLGWSTISSVTRNGVSLLQVAILTRFLAKEDFGIIAIATLFVSFTQLFLDMGISAGILHKQDITKQEYSSLFWLNIFTGLLLTAILYVVSPLITKGYGSEDLTTIVRLLCFSIFINAIGTQQRTYCQKKYYFKRMALLEIISALATFIVALVTAYYGYGAYSLAYSTLAGAIVFNAGHFAIGLVKDSRLSFHFNVKETRPFLRIGIYQVGSSILDFFSRELDILIVSATLGLEFLGIYNIAKKIPTALYSFIQPIVAKVFTPLFAEVNKNIMTLKTKYILTSKALSWMSFPMYFFVGAIAPTLLSYVFGSDYVEGAYIVVVFCVMYAFNGVNGICGALQVATGRTDIGLKWTIYRIISTALIYYVASLFGLRIFLLGILFSILLNVYMVWYIQFRTIVRVSLSEYLNIYKTSLLLSLILSIAIAVVNFSPSIVYSICSFVIYVPLFIYLIFKSSDRMEIEKVMQTLGVKKWQSCNLGNISS